MEHYEYLNFGKLKECNVSVHSTKCLFTYIDIACFRGSQAVKFWLSLFCILLNFVFCQEEIFICSTSFQKDCVPTYSRSLIFIRQTE